MKEILFWAVATAFLLALMLVGRITPESNKGLLIVGACGLLLGLVIWRIARGGR